MFVTWELAGQTLASVPALSRQSSEYPNPVLTKSIHVTASVGYDVLSELAGLQAVGDTTLK